jgi:ATP-dependent Lon protease
MLQPLLDRIEIIHVPAYLPIEKIKIAQNYLIPRFEKEYGFVQTTQQAVTEAAISTVTEDERI